MSFIIWGIVLSRIQTRKAVQQMEQKQGKQTQIRAIHSILYIVFFGFNANFLFALFLFMVFPNFYPIQAILFVSWFISVMYTFAGK